MARTNGFTTTGNWAILFFIFQAEWRFTPRGADEKRYNSGIGIRLSRYGEIWYQAQTGLSGGYLFGENFAGGTIQKFNLSKQMKTA